MAVYCVDSSSWILAADNYPLDRPMFENFWSWLDAKVAAGIVIAPDEVLVELAAKGHGPLVKWVKERKQRIFQAHDADVQLVFKQINTNYPDLTRKGKPEAKSDGDAWVISLAAVRGAVCVSEDRKRRQRVSFPIVCEAHSLECIFLREFIARES